MLKIACLAAGWSLPPIDGYTGPTQLGEAEATLDELESLWSEKYPIVIKPWRTKWEHLSAYFKYPEDIRWIIYTTNSIEAVHRQFRKLTKTKGGFPNNDSLLKLLYMGIQNASKKWTMPIQNWNLTISQLSIFFDGRLDAALKLWSDELCNTTLTQKSERPLQ
jgi:putative transposase